MLYFPNTFDLCSVGCEAARLVGQHASGKVLAVFDRSAYLQCGTAVFCIALSSIGPGPLHLLIDGKYSLLPFTLRSGQVVTFSSASALDASISSLENTATNTRLHLAASDVHFTGEVQGSGLLPTAQSARQCKVVLNGISSSSIPVNGFAWLLDDAHWSGLSVPTLPLSDPGSEQISNSLNRQCRCAIVSLYRWLKTHGASDNEAAENALVLSGIDPGVHELLGAGPGLTPSGDDLLAGVMLTLHALGCASTADVLWQFLEPHCARQTNIISAAYLRLAAQGRCSDSMLRLLDCVLSQGLLNNMSEIADRARTVQGLAECMGATSGWDALAGASLVLRAYSESVNRNKPDVTNKTQL